MNNITLENLNIIAKPFEYGKANSDLIIELEKKVDSKLPQDFKEFLIEWGGYSMLRKYKEFTKFSFIINFPSIKGGKNFVGFDQSLPIKAIIDFCDEWGDSIPDKSIVFEESGGSSKIFISMKSGSIGEVYYMERDLDMHFPEFDYYEDEDAAVEAFDPTNEIIQISSQD